MQLNFTHIVLAALTALAILGGVAIAVWPSSGTTIEVVQPTPAPAPAPTQAPGVGVYISGAVAEPGVYIVDEGARLAHIVMQAGGANPDADLAAVNLAVVVQDEDHWHIPSRAEAADAPPTGGLAASGRDSQPSARGLAASGRGASGAGADGVINLNAASADELMRLPGIGAVRAQAIVSHREAHGDFASVDALADVSGIGIGTVNAVRALVSAE